MQVNCVKCSQPIALTDVIESSAGRLSHLDCARSQGITPEERALLFVYCSDHAIATCRPCGLQFRMMNLAADPLGGLTNLCPRCRTDLTTTMRLHLFSCAVPPAEILRLAQEVREAARMLVKQSQQTTDSDVLIRKAEAHLLTRQRTLLRAMATNGGLKRER
jgi:hypothetical protein